MPITHSYYCTLANIQENKYPIFVPSHEPRFLARLSQDQSSSLAIEYFEDCRSVRSITECKQIKEGEWVKNGVEALFRTNHTLETLNNYVAGKRHGDQLVITKNPEAFSEDLTYVKFKVNYDHGEMRYIEKYSSLGNIIPIIDDYYKLANIEESKYTISELSTVQNRVKLLKYSEDNTEALIIFYYENSDFISSMTEFKKTKEEEWVKDGVEALFRENSLASLTNYQNGKKNGKAFRTTELPDELRMTQLQKATSSNDSELTYVEFKWIYKQDQLLFAESYTPLGLTKSRFGDLISAKIELI